MRKAYLIIVHLTPNYRSIYIEYSQALLGGTLSIGTRNLVLRPSEIQLGFVISKLAPLPRLSLHIGDSSTIVRDKAIKLPELIVQLALENALDVQCLSKTVVVQFHI